MVCLRGRPEICTAAMSVRYEAGGAAYRSQLHVAEPLGASDAICLASLTLLLGGPCPELTPAVRSLEKLCQTTQATNMTFSARVQSLLEAELSDTPISFSDSVQISPLALQVKKLLPLLHRFSVPMCVTYQRDVLATFDRNSMRM